MSGRLVLLALATILFFPTAHAQKAEPKLPKVGVSTKTEKIAPGYTLISPLSSNRVFLLNNDGMIVHYWETGHKPGQSAYLLSLIHI